MKQFIQLGEQIGDVKKEAWKKRSRAIISQLHEDIISNRTVSHIDDKTYDGFDYLLYILYLSIPFHFDQAVRFANVNT